VGEAVNPVRRHDKRKSDPVVVRINRLKPPSEMVDDRLRKAELTRTLLENAYTMLQEAVDDGVEFEREELELIDAIGHHTGQKAKH
jgi:hypothetical protein